MAKQISVVLLGAGNRANVYASVSLTHPEKLKVVGIVDPDPVRTELMRTKYNVPKENCFSDVSEFVKRDKFADAVINGTMDHLHVPTSIPVLEKGYDLLLEKPFAVNAVEMEELRKVAKANNSKVVIGHVLRYTDFYRSIKDVILSGRIGKIKSIETCEHVNFIHMAVAFVRGKWRSEKICYTPMILQKSCHDIDILLWMMNETKPKSIASFGCDFEFGKENKPENAGTRCTVDCPIEKECPYSAKSNYVTTPWFTQYVFKALEGEGKLSDERKLESISTDNPYGKCVWDFERDGNVDHQNVIINFENGATGTFTLSGGSPRSERNIHIIGTKGEIKGTFEDSKFVIRHRNPDYVTYTEELVDLKITGDMTGATGSHGGGDPKLVHDFIDYLNGAEPSVSCATLEDSVISHKVVFRAEQARKSKSIVDID